MDTEKAKNQYQGLSPEARKRNIEYATKYNRENTTKITVKLKKESFADIENYMNKAIANGKAKSKNDFIIQCLRRCVDDDYFDVTE